MSKDKAPTKNFFSIMTIFEALQEQIAKNIEINQLIFDKCSDMNKILIEMSNNNQKETCSDDDDQPQVRFQEQIQKIQKNGIEVIPLKRCRVLKGVIFIFFHFFKTKKCLCD